ncbi:hypothetical protein [Sporosalibacterium faouarense]|uniref:hypothetical protein n=1 Tax=Sporosalibacterium faouarense TaxID=516123 RepID=UPI00192AFE3E|nr:hypothetical protein [Sporosalibacterium faouarense]
MKISFDKLKDLIIILLIVVMLISFEYITNDRNLTHASSNNTNDELLIEKAKFWGVNF